MRGTLFERLMARSSVEGSCFVYHGPLHGSSGYAKIKYHGRDELIHRASHMEFIGPIPEGYHVDHVLAAGCTSRACWNPSHLEAVTREENDRRRQIIVKSLTCRKGHAWADQTPFDRTRNGEHGTRCQICKNQMARETRQRAKVRKLAFADAA